MTEHLHGRWDLSTTPAQMMARDAQRAKVGVAEANRRMNRPTWTRGRSGLVWPGGTAELLSAEIPHLLGVKPEAIFIQSIQTGGLHEITYDIGENSVNETGFKVLACFVSGFKPAKEAETGFYWRAET